MMTPNNANILVVAVYFTVWDHKLFLVFYLCMYHLNNTALSVDKSVQGNLILHQKHQSETIKSTIPEPSDSCLLFTLCNFGLIALLQSTTSQATETQTINWF